MSQAEDFVIRDGALLKYQGAAGVVTVPEGIMGVCANAFRNSDVEEVVLPEGLKWLASQAFFGCSRLRRLVLPGTLRIVPPELCRQDGALEEVVIAKGIVCILDRAFAETGLRRVTIPNSVRAIGEGCFMGCRNLETISLAKGLRALRRETFASCDSLETVSIPSSLLSLGVRAFHGCANLKTVRMQAGLLSVGSEAFASCGELKEVVLPVTLENIQADAFGASSPTVRVSFRANRGQIMNSERSPLAPVILAPRMLPEWIPTASRPAALAGYRELKVARRRIEPAISAIWKAYSEGTVLHNTMSAENPFHIVDGILCGSTCTTGTVTIPEGVTGIRAEVFQETDIREIRLPDSLEWIHAGAFRDCQLLEAVRLPAGLTRIPEALFQGCQALKSIQLPDAVTWIESRAFQDTGLESVSLPPYLKSIDSFAFQGCRQLRQVLFPTGLLEIRTRAFSLCSSLTRVALPDSLALLAADAFADCAELRQVSMGAGLCGLDRGSFRGCPSLREVAVSADLFFLREECFPDCPDDFRIRLAGSVVDLASTDLPPRIIAPNADPAIPNCENPLPLLRGFLSEDGKGFRYETEYLELLRLYRRELLDSEPAVRFFLRHDMLEREDIPECLKALQSAKTPDLVAEVQEYGRRRFPEAAEPL